MRARKSQEPDAEPPGQPPRNRAGFGRKSEPILPHIGRIHRRRISLRGRQNTGLSVGGGAFQATLIGQAGEQAIVKAVELIASSMRSVPWSAMVIDANNGMVYVNAGADRNVQVGLALNVYRQGRVFTDPTTGVVLDVDFQKIGTLRVVGVREKLSTAVVDSGETPVRGNLLRQN